MSMDAKTLVWIGGLAASVIGGGFETVKTVGPYLKNPPPLASEDQVAQALQAVQKGVAITNARQLRDERHQTQSDLRLNAIDLSTAATTLADLQVEVKLHPKDTVLSKLRDNAQQRVNDLQAEHDALRAQQFAK